MKRSYIKSKPRKTSAIRISARNQDCTLRFDQICNFNPETTVLCHSNHGVDGLGMGIKSSDLRACFGCSSCHDILDSRAPSWFSKDQIDHIFENAVSKTHIILKRMGLIEDDAND